MPTKNNIEYGPGVILIDGIKTNTFDISEFKCDVNEVCEIHRDEIFPIIIPDEFSLTFTMKFNKRKFYELTGLYSWAYENCPNRRVRHLMYHGKTARVRMKNFNRALNIIGELIDKAGGEE